MIAQLPTAVQDSIDALPLILALIAAVGWLARKWRAWMVAHIARPIAEVMHLVEYHCGPNSGQPKLVDRVIDLSDRVQTLEVIVPIDAEGDSDD